MYKRQHLDRYDYCFQNYVDAKMRITQNQNSRDFFIYSGDDEVIWQQLPKYDPVSYTHLPRHRLHRMGNPAQIPAPELEHGHGLQLFAIDGLDAVVASVAGQSDRAAPDVYKRQGRA